MVLKTLAANDCAFVKLLATETARQALAASLPEHRGLSYELSRRPVVAFPPGDLHRVLRLAAWIPGDCTRLH